MQIIDIKDLDNTTIKEFHVKIVDGYNSFYYTDNIGNCKICTLDNITKFNSLNDQRIENIKKLLNKVEKLAFNCTLNNEEDIAKLSNHFKLIYCVSVPIGYNSGFQYHCSFLTNNYYSKREHYIDRIKEEGVVLI